MQQTLLKENQSFASQKVKPKIDTVRLEQLVTQYLLKDIPLSILIESYDISYKQMGLIINLTRGFEHQTIKMDHTFDSFSYEAIPEDYFAIPHVLPEEKHYNYDKVMSLFTELEEIKNKITSIVTIDNNFLKIQIQKYKDKLESYDANKIKNIQGFVNEFDQISLHKQPTPEILIHLLEKYNLSIKERESLNQLYEEYLKDQNKLLNFEQELIRQQQQEKEKQKLEKKFNQIRDELVTHNIKLVNWCIRRFFNTIPLPKEDAQSYGLEGLCKAINQFDYKKGFHFSTYAVPAIVHTIQKNFKELTGYKWEDYIKINSINYYRDLMQIQSGIDHRPTPEELANMGLLDLSVRQIRTYDEIERYGRIEPLSSVQDEIEADYPETKRYEMPMTQDDYDLIDAHEDELAIVTDLLGTVTDSHVTDYAYSVIARETIFKVLETLTPREQKVLENLYGLVDGKQKSLREVAMLLNVGRERVRQIEAKALRRLRHPHLARQFREFIDMDFVQLDQFEHRPKTHIAIEKIYVEYYSLAELNLDKQTIIERLEKDNKKSTPYRIEYLLEQLPNIESSIINLVIQNTPFEKISVHIYEHHDVLFSDEFIIKVLNRYKEKLPEEVIEKLDKLSTKKM